MKWNYKISAGSLQFVIFIGVVIALLLLTFVTLTHTNSIFYKKTERFENTIKAANLGLNTALKTKIPINDSTIIRLPTTDEIKTKVIREYWGVLEKYTVVSTFKTNRFVKSVLVGNKSPTTLPALYLQDNQRPMIIVGKAKITGDAFLPKQGIRPGNISGNSFYGTSLVSGRKLESSSQLPKLNSELRQWIQELSKNNLPNKAMEILALSRNTEVKNSFKQTTKIVRGTDVLISGVSLSGNIIISATKRIIVEASSTLKDVILIAPEISIKNGVSGAFQAIASIRIEVGENCTLAYPTALVVNQKPAATITNSSINKKQNITLGTNSTIKGFIMYLNPNTTKQIYYPQIKIETGAYLWGEIYCEKNLELKGNVIGGVNTAGFMSLENGSIYQNHLFNGKINSHKLPEQYSGLPLTENNTSKTIAKWLY